MKKKLLLKTACLALSALVLVGCGPKGPETFIVGKDNIYGDYFLGKKGKKVYNAFASGKIEKSLNYLKYNDGALAKHWANFLDGLLLQNEYGVLEKLSADKVHQEANKTFTIDVKKGLPWVRYDNTIYSAMVDGVREDQYVSADDFYTSAEAVLNYANSSNLSYLYTNFIQGATEYNKYTEIKTKIKSVPEYEQLYGDDPVAFASYLTELVRAEEGEEYPEITASDLDKIGKFERVQIKVKKHGEKEVGGGQIEYTLKNPAFYFPTLLAYSCYLPVNKYYLDEIQGFSNLGSTDTQTKTAKLLFNGPFVLDTLSDTIITYKKNIHYNKDRINRVLVDEINFKVIAAGDEIKPDTARKEFLAGNVDAFALTQKDTAGWKEYITGPDGKGTLEDPYNPLVNSRVYDYIDYVSGLQINVNRASSKSKGSESSKTYANNPSDPTSSGSYEAITNAEKALRLSEVREFVIESFDIPKFNMHYTWGGSASDGQYAINTFVPKGFVQDEKSEDYTTSHYYKVYAEHYNAEHNTNYEWQDKVDAAGNVIEESFFTKKLKQGQYEGVYIPHTKSSGGRTRLNELREKALKAIEVYNDTIGSSDPITLPVQMEMFSVWQDTVMRGIDVPLFLAMNRRLNNIYDPKFEKFSTETVSNITHNEDGTTSGGFLVIPTYQVKSDDSDTVTNGGNWDLAAIWGWGPDYGDPMSYMNTYTAHGDWCNILGYVGDDAEETMNYTLNATGDALIESTLLGEYSDLVKEANKQTENINDRYDLFAEAEYMLLNELHIFRPLMMDGQGRSASISRAAGYKNPQGSYGLARDRQDGVLVLVEPINRAERNAALAKYEAAKKAYTKEFGTMNIY